MRRDTVFIVKVALLGALTYWVVTHRPGFWPLLAVFAAVAVAC